MKKKIIIIVVIVIVVILVYFLISNVMLNRKKLECTKIEDTTGMSIETTYTDSLISILFSSANFLSINLKLDSEYVKYKDTIKRSIKEQYKDFTKYDGVSSDLSVNNDVIMFKMNVDVSKLGKDAKKDLELDQDNIDTIKKNYENNGYTCE